MVSVNKIPATRLIKGGSERVDRVVRDPDTRTLQELKDTISAYSETIPVVSKYAEEIKKLPKKHMGIVADTIELSEYSQLFAADVNLKKEQDGVVVLGTLINDIIMASKYNPSGLNLVSAIINNTDALTSKFALYVMNGGAIADKQLSKQMEEAAKVVPQIAEETLKSHEVFDFSERMSFMTKIRNLVSKNVVPEKIESFYKDIMSFGKYAPESFKMDADKYLTSKTPMFRIKENLSILPQVLGCRPKSSGKFDIIEFVNKNTNIM